MKQVEKGSVSRRAARWVAVGTLLVAAACGQKSPTTPTGGGTLETIELVAGTGVEATAGRNVTVNYTGWLADDTRPERKGTQFDTSVGRTPFAFRLGAGQVIAGWDQGVPGMRVGGRRRLIIPPSLGYGATGAGGVIPPNATLVFDVELLAVQ
jgi:FKBP-type peptidyl-prolyl cis-trans isomerase FkpA